MTAKTPLKSVPKEPAAKKTAAKKAATRRRSATAKTTAKAASKPEEPAEQEAPQQVGFAITDQAAFARALGINPDLLVPNSLRVAFNQQGVAVVTYEVIMAVEPQQLGFAFMASSGMLGDGAAGQARGVPESAPEADPDDDDDDDA